MGSIWKDVIYALRTLPKGRWTTVAIILSLALGTGANTALFSIADAVLFQPPAQVRAPERLVNVYTGSSSSPYGNTSYPDYERYLRDNQVFSEMSAYRPVNLTLSTGGPPERIQGELVTGNYFSVLGVDARAGRSFQAEDNLVPNAHRVAILSHGLWQRRFGSDPDIVNQSIMLNGESFTVLGVAPRGFRGTSIEYTPEVWVPVMMVGHFLPAWGTKPLERSQWRFFKMTGRLEPGIAPAQAQAAINILASQIEQEDPGRQPREVTLVSAEAARFSPDDRDDVARYAGILIVVAGMVLLIACVNVANLLTSRTQARSKEIALRGALGANRRRLIQQHLTESMVLAVLGAGAGLLVARLSMPLVAAIKLPASVIVDPTLNSRVLLFALCVAVVTGVLFGLAPAVAASRANLTIALKDDASNAGKGNTLKLRGLLLMSQIALSLLLLHAAALLSRTFYNLQKIDPGFDPQGVLVVAVDPVANGYSKDQAKGFYRQLTDNLRSIPGLLSASLTSTLPTGAKDMSLGIYPVGYETPSGEPVNIDTNLVSPGYFATLRIPLVAGRDFTTQDRDSGSTVVVVSEALARQFWPGEEAVGKTLSFEADGPPWEVIGVAKDVKNASLRDTPTPLLYLPHPRIFKLSATSMFIVMRTDIEPISLLGPLQEQVSMLDSNLALFGVTTLAQHLSESLQQERQAATMFSLFSFLALTLGAVGLYGLMFFIVTRRTREIGIRIALGARPRNLLGPLFRETLVVVAVGVTLGLAASTGLTRTLSSILYGVAPSDPITLVIASICLLAVAALAGLVPVRRALTVDPVKAIKHE